jgi:hypothetical protein
LQLLVSGIGNVRDGLHPVQAAPANSHSINSSDLCCSAQMFETLFVSGIGNVRDGLHPVQAALANSHLTDTVAAPPNCLLQALATCEMACIQCKQRLPTATAASVASAPLAS